MQKKYKSFIARKYLFVTLKSQKLKIHSFSYQIRSSSASTAKYKNERRNTETMKRGSQRIIEIKITLEIKEPKRDSKRSVTEDPSPSHILSMRSTHKIL